MESVPSAEVGTLTRRVRTAQPDQIKKLHGSIWEGKHTDAA